MNKSVRALCFIVITSVVVLAFGFAACASPVAPNPSSDSQSLIATAVAQTVQSGAHAIETDNARIIAELTATTSAVRAQESAEFVATNSAQIAGARTATAVASLISPTPRPSDTPRPTQVPPPTPTPRFQLVTKKIGPIRESERDEVFSVQLTVKDVEIDQGSSFSRPKPGFEYMIVHVLVQNLGPGSIHSLYTTDFQIKDEKGALRGDTFLANTRDCALDLVDLTAGGSVEGCIGFEVPKTGRLEFIYAPFKYEGLKPGRYISILVRD